MYIYTHTCEYTPGYACIRVHHNFFSGSDIVMM